VVSRSPGETLKVSFAVFFRYLEAIEPSSLHEKVFLLACYNVAKVAVHHEENEFSERGIPKSKSFAESLRRLAKFYEISFAPTFMTVFVHILDKLMKIPRVDLDPYKADIKTGHLSALKADVDRILQKRK
jgi:hypothetical protein